MITPRSPLDKHILYLQILTLSRIPLAMLFSGFMRYTNLSGWSISVAALIIVVSEATDFLDGRLARKYGRASRWGAILDPLSDSIYHIVVYTALAADGLVFPIVPLILAVRDITIAYVRIVLSWYRQPVGAKWSGKIKAGTQAVCSVILLCGPLYWEYIPKQLAIPFVSGLLVVVTLGSTWEYFRSVYRAIRDMELTEEKPA
jgi:CDP-diacylglycerol---glycerol-3-phosphate 3-phosphatidyltransferase